MNKQLLRYASALMVVTSCPWSAQAQTPPPAAPSVPGPQPAPPAPPARSPPFAGSDGSPAPRSAASQPEHAKPATTTDTKFRDVLSLAREARCATAICWGEDRKWAIEPLVELPIGKTFVLPRIGGGASTLGGWINAHDVSLTFNAGLRFWVFWDWVSVSIYMSQPLLSGERTIHVPGSKYEHPASNIRRPYPGLALGLLGDSLWLGLDYQELLNGDAADRSDRNYARNQRISSALSLTVGIAAATSLRNGIGTSLAARAASDRKKAEAAETKAEEERKKAESALKAAQELAKVTRATQQQRGDGVAAPPAAAPIVTPPAPYPPIPVPPAEEQ
ncbi:hypothetical protein WME76_12295 [Sorangium sp. So ce119]|uniref:hypothetical protein n=1 Tax=Sorangium sp. So ce119 TaxID=3133279 RepID=UPI003F624F09